MKKAKDSTVLEIMRKVWDNLDYSSHQRVNTGMSNLLTNLIDMGLKFEKQDIRDAFKSFRGAYWFGVASNGKGYGEGFYSSEFIHKQNTSAAQSFE